MPVPSVCVPLGMTTLSHSPFFPNVLCLVPFPMSPPLAKPSIVMPSYPMDLPPTPVIVSEIPLWSLTFLGYHQKSSPVVLIPGLPCPPEGTACRDHYSLLRCVPVPLRWGLLCVPCPISTTSVYFTFSPERKIWCHIYSNLQPMKALALLLPWSFLKKKMSYQGRYFSGFNGLKVI